MEENFQGYLEKIYRGIRSDSFITKGAGYPGTREYSLYARASFMRNLLTERGDKEARMATNTGKNKGIRSTNREKELE